MRFHRHAAALLTVATLLVLGGAPARAALLDSYQLGEADPGAVAGNVGNNPTTDSGPGANNLPSDGSPVYSSNAAPGSTISMSFNGSSDYMLSSPVTSLTNDVGISAWVFPTINNTVAAIAYNGNSGGSGYGIYQYGSGQGANPPAGYATVGGLVGGVTLGPTANIPLNTWTLVTQIQHNGQDELFINNAFAGSVAATPHAPTTLFDIGGHQSEYFTGNIDSVKVFTTPEPASMITWIMAALGLLLVAHRRKA